MEWIAQVKSAAMARQADEQKGATNEAEKHERKEEKKKKKKTWNAKKKPESGKMLLKRKSNDDQNVSWAACFLIFRLQTISQSFCIGYPYHTEFNLGQHTKNIPNNRFRRFQEGVYCVSVYIWLYICT